MSDQNESPVKFIIGLIICLVIIGNSIRAGYRYYITSSAKTYIVVDLSGGPSATSYSVTKLSDVPEGGWTDEYKTSKLVLRKITITEVKMQGTEKDYHYVGVFEVTQAQWKAIMGNNPSGFKGDLSRPVERISWNDCQEFIKKLNARTEVKSAGITFRLPTEEEWEYACLAGAGFIRQYGLLTDGREGTLDEMGWYYDNSGGETHPVGQKKPNAWGLYDMHGNVMEWTASEQFGTRVYHGGSWNDYAEECGAISGYGCNPDSKVRRLGFRLAGFRTGK